MNRRTLLRGAAWTTPAVIVATAAPAYATSDKPPIRCTVTGCKKPGKPRGKAYHVHITADGHVTSVLVDDRPATRTAHGWRVDGFRDSRNYRTVAVTTTEGTWTGVVAFPPCHGGAHR